MPDFLKIAELVELGEVKALSIRQPWPDHIFNGGKDVENRKWSTNYRGWFIIHAGIAFDGAVPAALADLPRGGIVGMARIVDCVEDMDSNWFFGPYGFVLEDAFQVDLIPCAGRLSFFYPEPDALEQLAAALRAKAA